MMSSDELNERFEQFKKMLEEAAPEGANRLGPEGRIWCGVFMELNQLHKDLVSDREARNKKFHELESSLQFLEEMEGL